MNELSFQQSSLGQAVDHYCEMDFSAHTSFLESFTQSGSQREV